LSLYRRHDADGQNIKIEIIIMKVTSTKGFEDAINKLTSDTVMALGVKGWVLVSKGHPLLKSVRHFAKKDVSLLTEDQATQISKSPYVAIV